MPWQAFSEMNLGLAVRHPRWSIPVPMDAGPFPDLPMFQTRARSRFGGRR
jgi:hypothetical protein